MTYWNGTWDCWVCTIIASDLGVQVLNLSSANDYAEIIHSSTLSFQTLNNCNIYMQSNKIHNVVSMNKFYSALFISSTCFGPHRSIVRSVLYKLYSQTLVRGNTRTTRHVQYIYIYILQDDTRSYNVKTEQLSRAKTITLFPLHHIKFIFFKYRPNMWHQVDWATVLLCKTIKI